MSGVEEKMFPPKILDLSRVDTRPTKKPSSYEKHKSNLKRLLRERQRQIQGQRINAPKTTKIRTPAARVKITQK